MLKYNIDSGEWSLSVPWDLREWQDDDEWYYRCANRNSVTPPSTGWVVAHHPDSQGPPPTVVSLAELHQLCESSGSGNESVDELAEGAPPAALATPAAPAAAAHVTAAAPVAEMTAAMATASVAAAMSVDELSAAMAAASVGGRHEPVPSGDAAQPADLSRTLHGGAVTPARSASPGASTSSPSCLTTPVGQHTPVPAAGAAADSSPPAPWLSPHRSMALPPWPDRPLHPAPFFFHATRWGSLERMHDMRPVPKLRSAAVRENERRPNENYDGVLCGEQLGRLKVIFFHTQSWAKQGTPYPEDYLIEHLGGRARYVPVLTVSVDAALGKQYNYGVFLMSDESQGGCAGGSKRLIKLVIAARVGGAFCPAAALEAQAVGTIDSESPNGHELLRRVEYYGDAGPAQDGRSVGKPASEFFRLCYDSRSEPRWSLEVPDMTDDRGQYCALDVAIAYDPNYPDLPLSLFEGGGRLPDSVVPPTVGVDTPDRWCHLPNWKPGLPKIVEPGPGEAGFTRVWLHKQNSTSEGGMMPSPPGHTVG